MINLKNIESLTAFKRNTSYYIKRLKHSGDPIVLTINGKAKLIIQDMVSYQRMLEVLNHAAAIELTREGLDSVKQGKTMSLNQFDKEMRKKIRTLKKR